MIVSLMVIMACGGSHEVPEAYEPPRVLNLPTELLDEAPEVAEGVAIANDLWCEHLGHCFELSWGTNGESEVRMKEGGESRVRGRVTIDELDVYFTRKFRGVNMYWKLPGEECRPSVNLHHSRAEHYIVNTAVHELGHLLGYFHSEGNVMQAGGTKSCADLPPLPDHMPERHGAAEHLEDRVVGECDHE